MASLKHYIELKLHHVSIGTYHSQVKEQWNKSRNS
jgi:hypothetical protein